MTAPTLPPERVAELAGALNDADPLALDNTRHEWALRSIAESLAPLIGGWLAEAAVIHPDVYAQIVADAREEGAAEVRTRVEALADQAAVTAQLPTTDDWDRGWRKAHVKFEHSLRAALVTEREEGEVWFVEERRVCPACEEGER